MTLGCSMTIRGEPIDDVPSAHRRHHEIENEHLPSFAAREMFDGLLAVRRFRDVDAALPPQHRNDQLSEHGVIIDN
jgi:hypothetical protein